MPRTWSESLQGLCVLYHFEKTSALPGSFAFSAAFSLTGNPCRFRRCPRHQRDEGVFQITAGVGVGGHFGEMLRADLQFGQRHRDAGRLEIRFQRVDAGSGQRGFILARQAHHVLRKAHKAPVPTGTFSRMRDVDVNRLLASRSLESTESSPKNPNILGEIIRKVRLRSHGSVGITHWSSYQTAGS